MTTTDAEGNKVIAKGSSRVLKEHSYGEMKQFQWNVNQPQNFGFNDNRLLKFELRRPPTNEQIMDLVIRWDENNPTAVPVRKLPTFWNCCDSIRIHINNKEVCDLKDVQGIRTEFRSRLLENHQNANTRDNHYYWQTGISPIDNFAISPELFNVPVIPANDSLRFYTSFKDIINHFCSLPLNQISLIEIEIQLTTDLNLIADEPEALQIQHNNIQVWSLHKQYVIPKPRQFSNHTLWHREHEVLLIPVANTPFEAPFVAPSTYTVDLHTFFARRNLIQRIHVYAQRTNSADSFVSRPATWIESLELLRNGDRFMGTQFFYEDQRSIFKASQDFYKRHSGGSDTRSNPNSINWGQIYPQTFVDTSTVGRTINITPIAEPHSVASEGIDNQTNIELRITNRSALAVNSFVVVIIEWMRFDRISPAGNVVRILNA